ncbi:hypothetical protein FEM48_Zijuj01G0266000 [Ziziphus jujuba var. spinosa]|uniref:DUF4220 domain-containing protein n=1 Tax=Ziziphus jujuba var. spinosa TaxID=714518 RepID=A0A978W516_ZIZJJ|nr:hypothetical protein FEM48_Zijuj01G0266000 [Ziziphus jujuba var. spinosa]
MLQIHQSKPPPIPVVVVLSQLSQSPTPKAFNLSPLASLSWKLDPRKGDQESGRTGKNWELRAMVLLSLNLQIILLFLGNRRKRIAGNSVRIVLWCAYLMANSVATVALGIILDNLESLVEGVGGDGRLLDPNVELTSFWTPFLLLH